MQRFRHGEGRAGRVVEMDEEESLETGGFNGMVCEALVRLENDAKSAEGARLENISKDAANVNAERGSHKIEEVGSNVPEVFPQRPAR